MTGYYTLLKLNKVLKDCTERVQTFQFQCVYADAKSDRLLFALCKVGKILKDFAETIVCFQSQCVPSDKLLPGLHELREFSTLVPVCI